MRAFPTLWCQQVLGLDCTPPVILSSCGPLWSQSDPPWQTEPRFWERERPRGPCYPTRHGASSGRLYLHSKTSVRPDMLEPYQADTLIYVTKSISEILMLSTLFFLSLSVIRSQKKFVLRNSLPPGPLFKCHRVYWEKCEGAYLWVQKRVLLVISVTVDVWLLRSGPILRQLTNWLGLSGFWVSSDLKASMVIVSLRQTNSKLASVFMNLCIYSFI